MRCPKCRSSDDRVVDSRDNGINVRRRRKCRACGHRWTTYEGADVTDAPDMVAVPAPVPLRMDLTDELTLAVRLCHAANALHAGLVGKTKE